MQVMMSLLGADQLWGALRAPTFGGDGATIRPTSNGQPLGGTRGKWERPRIASPGPFLGCRQQSRRLPLVDAKARLPGGLRLRKYPEQAAGRLRSTQSWPTANIAVSG